MIKLSIIKECYNNDCFLIYNSATKKKKKKNKKKKKKK